MCVRRHRDGQPVVHRLLWFSAYQVELRRRFPGVPVLVLTTTNGGVGYLCPRETYGSGLYQEQQSPYAPGCLEETIDAAAAALTRVQGA